MYFVVAYDVPNSRRRRKILETLKNYGFPVQLSVVEGELDADRLQRMRAELKRLIEPRQDRVRLYRLCATCYYRSEVLAGSGGPRTG
jgi:CRISPR-associated protein Cas2